MNAEPTRDARDDRIDEIIAEYLQAVEAGQRPDGQTLIDRYPEHADALREFLADRQHFARAAEAFQDDAVDPDAPTLNGVLHEPPDPMPGTFVRYFGDYELLQEIARGGMGVVYEARQISLNRTVALKMILSGQLASDAEVKRFAQEAEAAANLDHPNIVPIHEVGRYKGRHYFTMKLIDGGPLSEHLARLKGDLRAAAKMMVKVARAVDFAHRRGILHRDLKPANVLLDAAGEPHVTDFGLAKRVDRERDVTITKPGGVLGTPAYMAPEQAAGERDLTTAADVYSLGAILYILLTGEPPFRAATPLDTLRQVMDKAPRPPRAVNAAVPRDLETICLKCLEKDPPRRYDSAAALADELGRWLNHEPIAARPVSVAGRMVRWCRRNPALAAVSAVAASVIIALSSVYYVNLTAKHKQTVVALRQEKAWRRERRIQVERAQDALASSQYEQARALVLSGTPGRRWRAMELLREANKLRTRNTRLDYVRSSAERIPLLSAADLRTAAVAALMQTDARTVSQGNVMMGMPPSVSADGHVAVTPYMTGINLPRFSYQPGTPPGKVQPPKMGVRVLNTATGTEVGRIADLSKFSFGVLSPPVSPDGKVLAMLSPISSEVHLLSLPDGGRIKTLELPPDTSKAGASDGSGAAAMVPMTAMMSSGAFGPDGKRFAAVRRVVLGAKPKIEVIVWNIETGKGRWVGSWDSGELALKVAFSATGKRIAVTDRTTTLHLIDLAGAPSAREIRLPLQTYGTAVFSGDDALLAVSCLGGKPPRRAMLLWDLAQNKEKLRLLEGSVGEMHLGEPGFSPDGKRLAVGDRAGNVIILDTETGAERWRIKIAQRGGAWHVTWQPDGRHLVVAGASGEISRWEISPNPPVTDLPTGGELAQFAFSPDARRLAVGSGRVTRLIDLRTGQVQRELPFAGHMVFRPDGKQLAVTSFNTKKRQVVAYDLATGDEVFRTERPFCQAEGLSFAPIAFGPQGQLLIVRNEPDRTVVWDMVADRLHATVPKGKPDSRTMGMLTPDGRMLIRALRRPDGPRYEVWDLVNQRKHMQIDIVEGSMVPALPKFSPDYQWAAMVYFVIDLAATRTGGPSGGADTSAGVVLQNTKTPGKQVHIRNRRLPTSLDFSPDGKLLAIAYLAGVIEIYTLPNMKPALSFQTTDRGDPMISFTPDGKSLAVSHGQSPIRLIHMDKLNRELDKIGLAW